MAVQPKRIPLTQGKMAIVDSEDFEWLNQWKWQARNNNGRGWYAVRGVWNGASMTPIAMHRVIMGLQKGDKRQVDHINRNGLDNRKCNLRVCTAKQNTWNSKPRSGTSKYKGVYSQKGRGKIWKAKIQHTHLGSFDDELDAAIAYKIAANNRFGDFAYGCAN